LHISSEKARSILDQILSSELDNLLEEEPQVAEANSLPDIPSTSVIPSSKQEEEENMFPDFMLDIKPDLFSDFGNMMNHHSIKKPQNQNHHRESLNPSKDISSRSTLAELVSIISSEWLEESELSSDVICLDSPSLPIC
jgi:hypothetical protein